MCTNSHKKRKGGGSANAPALCEVCLRSSNLALLPAFSHQGRSNDCPCACFARFLLVRRLSRVFPGASREVEENCLTPQLSSAVARLVLEVKPYAFSLRAIATFTLFDQVSRACPGFSPLREASGRQSEICACSSVPSPAPSTENSCLQVSAKRPEPLKVSSPLTSS